MRRLSLSLALLVACGTPEDDPSQPEPAPDPSIASIRLVPDLPMAGESVSCEWSLDDASDDATAEVQWRVDGLEAGTGNTLSAEMFDAYQDVTCSVTVLDGEHSISDEVTAQADEPCGGLAFFYGGLTAEDHDDLVLGTEAATLTAEAWVYLEPVDSGSRTLLWKQEPDTSASSAYVDWGLLITADNALAFGTGLSSDDCAYLNTGADSVPTEEWAHVAVSYTSDGLTTAKRAFVNGVLLQDCETETKNSANGGVLTVGAAVGGAHPMWRGSLDEVRISSVDCYGATDFTPTPYHHLDGDTVALWHFNQDDDDARLDASENAHHLTDLDIYDPPTFHAFGTACPDTVPDYEPWLEEE